MAELTAFTAEKLFTGERWLAGHAVVVSNENAKERAADHDSRLGNHSLLPVSERATVTIHSVVPVSELPPGIELVDFNDAIICPAFIDVQIYGAGGKLFSAWPDAASLQVLAEENRKGGTALCLPTIATNSMEVVRRCIDATRLYWNSGGTGVYGLHLEGPWINPLRKGAHLDEYITSPLSGDVEELLEYGKDVIRMITLAPECCEDGIIRSVLSKGIRVSAGHTNATYQQAINAFDLGVTTVTHLFNAMSPLQHRAPGMAGAAMDHSTVMASIIPDGVHVDFAALRIAARVMKERLFVITDAVTETSTGPYQHQLAGNYYESAGILSGSALQMNVAVRNLVEHGGIGIEEAIRMCSLYPAKMLGIHHTHGFLLPGYTFCATVLNKQLEVIDVRGAFTHV